MRGSERVQEVLRRGQRGSEWVRGGRQMEVVGGRESGQVHGVIGA